MTARRYPSRALDVDVHMRESDSFSLAIPDGDAFLDCLRSGFDEVLALAEPAPAGVQPHLIGQADTA